AGVGTEQVGREGGSDIGAVLVGVADRLRAEVLVLPDQVDIAVVAQGAAPRPAVLQRDLALKARLHLITGTAVRPVHRRRPDAGEFVEAGWWRRRAHRRAGDQHRHRREDRTGTGGDGAPPPVAAGPLATGSIAAIRNIVVSDHRSLVPCHRPAPLGHGAASDRITPAHTPRISTRGGSGRAFCPRRIRDPVSPAPAGARDVLRGSAPARTRAPRSSHARTAHAVASSAARPSSPRASARRSALTSSAHSSGPQCPESYSRNSINRGRLSAITRDRAGGAILSLRPAITSVGTSSEPGSMAVTIRTSIPP